MEQKELKIFENIEFFLFLPLNIKNSFYYTLARERMPTQLYIKIYKWLIANFITEQLSGLSSLKFSLPSEAQWENAAMSGVIKIGATECMQDKL